jgi:hypothetical protein
MQRIASSPLPRAGEVTAYLALSIAVSWPVLFVWSGCYCTNNNLLQPWPQDVARAANFLPEVVLAGALIVWAAYGRKTAVTLAGFGTVAGWIAMGLSISYVLPWLGAGHGVAAWPDPFMTLLVFAGALANSIGCSRILSRRLGRPGAGLTLSLVLVPISLLTGLGVYLNIRQSERTAAYNRGVEIGQGCERGEFPFSKEPHVERCFELAERTRKDAGGPDALALAREIYEWGCSYGEASSCAAAAGLHERGESVPTDRRKAGELYAKGCGFSRAVCSELARVFNEAGAATQDAQALGMMRASCRKATTGCLELGRMYESGTGVARSGTQALILYDLVCAAGEEVGCYNSRLFRSNSEKH